LKTLLLILTLSGILLQTFSKGFIMLGFGLNRSFIANNICVKKAEKDNCCKGSCQLKKQLLNDDQQEKIPTQNLKEKSNEQFFCQTIQLFYFGQTTTEQEFQQYRCVATPQPFIAVFHPPPIFVIG
jgi:hypothetical protein